MAYSPKNSNFFKTTAKMTMGKLFQNDRIGFTDADCENIFRASYR